MYILLLFKDKKAPYIITIHQSRRRYRRFRRRPRHRPHIPPHSKISSLGIS